MPRHLSRARKKNSKRHGAIRIVRNSPYRPHRRLQHLQYRQYWLQLRRPGRVGLRSRVLSAPTTRVGVRCTPEGLASIAVVFWGAGLLIGRQNGPQTLTATEPLFGIGGCGPAQPPRLDFAAVPGRGAVLWGYRRPAASISDSLPPAAS